MSEDAKRDDNNVTTLLGVSNADGVTPVRLYANPTTHRLLVDLAGAGSGTVTSASVVSANGFAGTVATATTTPAITLSTTVNGILKGNGTAISAVTIGSGLSFDGTTLSATGGGTGDVVGPASSTDNALARFDLATGKLLQDGTLTASDVAAGAVTLSTIGNNDMILQTGNATTGSITIADGAHGNITLAPNGTGAVAVQSTGATTYLSALNGSSYGEFNITSFSAEVGVYTSSGSFIDLYAQDGATQLYLTDTSAGVTGPVVKLYHASASPAVSDVTGQITFSGRDSGAAEQEYARIQSIIQSPTAGAENGSIEWGVVTAGTVTNHLHLGTSALRPVTNDSHTLGTGATSWSDLFLASGGVVNFNNGNYTLTHSAGLLTASGAFSVGTSNAITAGTIELGAATDTTISRSSAGVIAVEGVVIPSISSTNTLTNKRITKRVGSTTSSATPTINTDNVDAYHLTAQAVDITSFTTNLTGTPTDFQQLRISVTGTAARAITWGASFANGPVALPTTTVTTTRLDVLLEWDSVTSKWRCMASGSTV